MLTNVNTLAGRALFNNVIGHISLAAHGVYYLYSKRNLKLISEVTYVYVGNVRVIGAEKRKNILSRNATSAVFAQEFKELKLIFREGNIGVFKCNTE